MCAGEMIITNPLILLRKQDENIRSPFIVFHNHDCSMVLWGITILVHTAMLPQEILSTRNRGRSRQPDILVGVVYEKYASNIWFVQLKICRKWKYMVIWWPFY